MKKKILSGVMAVLMMLSIGTGCDDTLDSSTLAEYDRDSKANAELKEAQKQAKDALKTFDDRINSTQDKGESQAEPSQDEGGSQTDLSDEELKELGKIVEKNAYAFYCDTVADGVRFTSDQPLPIEIGKINATEEHIKKLQENVAKETSDKYKGYVATFAINRTNSELLVYVSISKEAGSKSLYTNFTPEEYI